MKRFWKDRSRRSVFENLEQRHLLTANSMTYFRNGVQLDNSISSEIVGGFQAMSDASLNSSTSVPERFLTTETDPANYVTPTGTVLDGVVELLMTFPSSGARGSGTLLTNGRQILSVAHNFFDSLGNLATSVSAVFHLPGGNQTVSCDFVDIGTGYNGNSYLGNDIAVLRMTQTAPSGASRFDIYRGSNELGQIASMSGYGRSGTGLTGSVLASGTKRNGSNRIDALGESLNGTALPNGTVASGKLLVFDFDDGTSTHDASAFYLGINNAGLGTGEVSTAPGDSGGPLLIDGKIAGVTDLGLGFNGGPDVLSGTNSSFGEFGLDTRVSAWASWIDSVAPMPGDYNRDGLVDRADYGVWRANYGNTVSPYSGADGNGNGIIDAADYVVWANVFDPINGFSIADFNRDGVVNSGDYSFWRSTFGNTVSPYAGADGNGNGVIDAADYVIWADVFGALNNFAIADYNHDGAVNIGDYNFWRSTFGNSVSPSTGADGNGNGVIDAGDYVIWRETFSSRVGAARFGILDAAFGPNVPPEVVGFALSNSAGGTFDFTAVAGSGEQLRSVPLSSANAISITFNQAVIVSQSALQIINLDGSAASVTSFAYDADSQTATWTFATLLADGRYLVRLADSVHNSSNAVLDGEFTNPWSLTQTGTSVFASGDGTAGGEFRFRFTVLAGDTDHDNIVGATNYQNWKSYEPGRTYVSTTADDFDSDVSFGDFSLREAIDYANNATEPTTIEVPAGRYALTRIGTEGTGTAYNDLDITGNVTILGAGPGFSIVAPGWSWVSEYQENRLFSVNGSSARLHLEGLTLANEFSYASYQGDAALAQNQATLEIVECAIVNNAGYGTGNGVRSRGSNLTVLRSVFTANAGYDGVAIESSVQGSVAGSLTIGDSIFALNICWAGSTYTPNVRAASTVTKTNLGHNMFDKALGGFFDTVPGTGDYLGTPTIVVTSMADTFDHSNDTESLSLREAIDKANTTAGSQEIWLPAWNFVLTRQRTTAPNQTELNISEGDLEITKSLVLRGAGGVSGPAAKVNWMSGAVADKVFELVGDYNSNGEVDTADYVMWASEQNQTGSNLPADGDDDGDVDANDYTIWSQNYSRTLQLFDIAV